MATTTTRIRSSAPFTVRDGELHRLLAVLEQAAACRGGFAEVGGDPGTGKSRLLTALSQQARDRGVTVLRGTCAEATAHLPFQPLIEAFGNWTDDAPQALPELIRALATPPDGTEPAQFTSRCRFFAELRKLLSACVATTGGGLLLVLDDAHWADLGTVELLDMLVRWPLTGQPAVVVAHRPRQSPAELRAVLERGAELAAVDVVRLDPLTLSQSAAVLQWAGGVDELAALHRRAEGNPLYLGTLAETARLGGHDGPFAGAPPTLTARLFTETARLNATERAVLHAAAVLGDPFDVDGVAEVAGVDRDDACRAIGRLRARDLVRNGAEPGQLVFRHPLLRRGLYAEADGCWRGTAHRRAAVRLAAAGAQPLELAPHIERAGAGVSDAEADVLAGAARAALHLGRPAEAAHWLSVTLRLAGPAAPALRGLWRSVVRALAAQGAADRVRAVSRAYLGVPGQGCGAPCADVAFLATVHAGLGRPEEARDLIAGHLVRLPPDADPDEEALLQLHMQLVQVIGGSLPTRSDVEALMRGTRHADPVTSAGALALQGLCAVLTGDTCAAEVRLGAAAEILDGVEGVPAPHLAEHLLVLGWAEALMGWHGASLGHVERAVPAVRENRDTHLLAPLLNTLAYAHYQSGRMADALDAAQEARSTGRAVGRADQVGLAEAVISAALAQLGGSAARRRAGTGPTPEVPRTPLNSLLHAEAALACGDGASALALLAPTGAAWRVSEPVPVLAARGYELLAAAALLSGAQDADIEEWVGHAGESAASTGLPEQSGHALLARGHLLTHRRRHDTAARTYEDAVDLLGADTPAGVRARQLARTARAEAGRDGAGTLLADLTSREREVAGLAGQGFKTKDVAERLHISPRTVDVHLARIYTKLGVDSKAALVRLMAAG
ncbi:helix-turn-helix transcriptional regulator [Actinacidiphila epipremni]|uniref:AAA family ATPase n=1 Tax=Actinacidiphila epipremni TaxID=2053013 RepID=A0ABX0ZMS6_9ACTN|nr:helix-turn-helix transcriptional regulator [Actinacidiphila epipremni]NJP45184.1 AAA family ATPase [Actinacidiphila epipremni]